MTENSSQLATSQSTPPSTFPKIPAATTCNGKIHRQDKYCQLPAGWGTDHPGKGRCKLHGGMSTGPKAGQLRYSDFVPTAMVEKYEEFAAEADVDIKSLNNEIALIRAKVTQLEKRNEELAQIEASDIQKFNDAKIERSNNDKQIVTMIESIRRLVETKQKVEEGVKSKVTIEVTMKVVDLFFAIIDKHVDDLKLKKLIATDMRRLSMSEIGMVTTS